ncbi:MAG: hypothetical protein V1882_12680 [Candidatus Omnitrophota bacterium]
MTVELQKTLNIENGYRRCLAKVVDRTGRFLREEGADRDYGNVHAVKSILYAAIEQAGMETDRMISAQELLRELLMLVALQADPVCQERQEALTVLEKLKKCHLGSFQI